MDLAAEHPIDAATQDNAAINTDALRDEALAKAVQLAADYEKLTHVANAVNEALDLEWSAAKWRGLWKDHPATRERVRKALGRNVGANQRRRTILIDGDVRGAVINDVHAPFHDPQAIALAIKVLKWWQPDVMVHNGDLMDFYGISDYDRSPERQYTLQDEIDIWHTDVLVPMLQAVKGRHVYLPGNHEDRLRRYLWRHPELYGVRSLELPNLLELDYYGVEYASFSVEFGDLLEVSHGTRVSKNAGYSAKAEQDTRRYSISTITGHVHRGGYFSTNTRRGMVFGQENGCLCSLQPEWLKHVDWVQGLSLFTVKNGVLNNMFVQFTKDYQCIAGREYFSF